MTETQLQDRIIDLCKWLGLLVYHVGRSDKALVSANGFPDLVIVGVMGTVFAELKSQIGKPTQDQKEWLSLLARTNDHVYLWRPSDWDNITKILKEVAGR
jgi:hypothetical protein